MNHFLNYISIIDNENKNKTCPSFFNTTKQAEETYFDHKWPVIAYGDNGNNELEEKIRHFGEDEEIILKASNAKKNLSTSVVNSMTFISDEHLIKPNSTTSNSLFWNTDSVSQKVSNTFTQKKSNGSWCFMNKNHLVDVPLSTIAFQNVPIGESVPIKFHNYQTVKKVPKEILLERDTSNSHTMFSSNSNYHFEFQNFSSSIKLSHSESSFLKQVESFYTAFGRDSHFFDFDTSEQRDADSNDDYFLRKCEPERTKETKTHFQCSKLHLQKLLHRQNEATNFPATRIQRVLGKTNDKANEISNLGNVLLESVRTNNLVIERRASPKSLHPEDKFSMPNLVGLKYETFEISLQDDSQNALRLFRSGKAFEDKVMHSFDCLKTLSCGTECGLQIQGYSHSHGNTIEDYKSESLFMKGSDISRSIFELPQSCTILKFQENSPNNNLPLVEDKDNYNKDAVKLVNSNKPLTVVFDAQEQRDRNKHVSDNNCVFKESEEDSSSSFDNSSWDEGSLNGEDQFYDCLEDISLEKSEKNSEIIPFSTDEDFVAIQDPATFPDSHFHEPVIFRYVEEDTHEVDEILIYPKIYMEKISNDSNKILTREEILPKLLENSKFYEGQPIGIFTHVKEMRKAIQNESLQKMYKYPIPASTHVGNGEPFLPQCNGHTFQSSKMNNLSVNVCVKRRKSNRKKLIKRNKVKVTSKQKFDSESKPFPRAFRRSNISQMVKTKSLQQTEVDYSGILYSNSIGKYFKSPDFQQEHKVLDSSLVSCLSKQNYEIHEAGDQLLTEIPSRRPAFDFTLFQKREFNDKSREQSKFKSGVSERSSYETSRKLCYASKHAGPSKSKAVLGKPSVARCSSSVATGKSSRGKTTSAETCRKTWGDSTHATSSCHRSASLEEASGCSGIARTIAPQKNNPSRQKLTSSMPIRKDLKVEDIVSSDFRSHFCFYAKMGHCLRSGSAISKSNSNYWLKRTGVVVDGQSRQVAEECFSFVAKSKLVLNIYDYVHYLTALSKRTKVCLPDLIRQMKSGDISTQRQKNVTLPVVGFATDRGSLPPRSRFTLSTQDNRKDLEKTPIHKL